MNHGRRIKHLEAKVEELEERLDKIGRRANELAHMEVNAAYAQMIDDLKDSFTGAKLGTAQKAYARAFCFNHNHDLPCPYCKNKEEA